MASGSSHLATKWPSVLAHFQSVQLHGAGAHPVDVKCVEVRALHGATSSRDRYEVDCHLSNGRKLSRRRNDPRPVGFKFTVTE
jgi:hypothetical protein